MNSPEIEIWQTQSGEKEIHIYQWENGIREWLFGINKKYVCRADIIEIMKIFHLEYPYDFLNQIP